MNAYRLRIIACILITVCCSSTCYAEVFYAQDEAIQLAFPQAESVEKKTFVLTDAQKVLAEHKAHASIASHLVTFYLGKKEGQPLGYALIDSRPVRSQNITYLVLINTQARIEKVVVLAFNEPPEYIVSPEWNKQFVDKERTSVLMPGQDIQGIAGSTLSVNAMSEGVRKALALHEILFIKS